MSDAVMTEPGAVLGDALAQLEAAVDRVAGVPAWSVQEQELPAAIRALARAETRVAAVRLALLREATDRGVPAAAGTTTARWLRGLLNASPGRAAEEARVADALRDAESPTAAALAAGDIGVEHATVITRVLAQVRADGADAEVVAEAEAFLLGQARLVDPATLAKLGRHLRYVADPSQGDDRLEVRERLQAARRELTMYEDPDGSGMTLLRGRLDPLGAATVAAALDPLAAPRPAADGARDPRSPARRRADALVELCQRALADGRLPTQGGERPTLIVTIGLAMLLGLLKASDMTGTTGDDGDDGDRDAAAASGNGLGGLFDHGRQDGHDGLAMLGDLAAPGRPLGITGVAGLDRPDYIAGPDGGIVGRQGFDGAAGVAEPAGLEWLPAMLPSGQPVSAATVRRSRAMRGSFRWCSARHPNRWTSAGEPAPGRRRFAGRWPPGTAAAPGRAVMCRRSGRRSTTFGIGPPAVRPASPMRRWCVTRATTCSTTATGRWRWAPTGTLSGPHHPGSTLISSQQTAAGDANSNTSQPTSPDDATAPMMQAKIHSRGRTRTRGCAADRSTLRRIRSTARGRGEIPNRTSCHSARLQPFVLLRRTLSPGNFPPTVTYEALIRGSAA